MLHVQSGRDSLPVKRRRGLVSRAPLRARNDERADSKFARNFHSPEFVEFTRSRPCACGCGYRPSEAAHAEPRGMGGCGADWTRIIPLYWKCHRAYDRHDRPDIEERKEQLIAEHQEAWRKHKENDPWTF